MMKIPDIKTWTCPECGKVCPVTKEEGVVHFGKRHFQIYTYQELLDYRSIQIEYDNKLLYNKPEDGNE